MTKSLDLNVIGGLSVHLCGDRIGGRLEDIRSLSKYIGGTPTNIAATTARLGWRSAVITRVGDDHMGRFVHEQLAREGMNGRHCGRPDPKKTLQKPTRRVPGGGTPPKLKIQRKNP